MRAVAYLLTWPLLVLLIRLMSRRRGVKPPATAGITLLTTALLLAGLVHALLRDNP